MKNIKILAGVTITLLGILILVTRSKVSIFKQGSATKINITDTLDDAISRGFSTGEVSILFPYFAESIIISIAEDENDYKAIDAQIPLTNFFQQHPPKGFSIVHSVKNKNGKEKYWIGDYTNDHNILFRVYILSNQERIQSIEISEKKVVF